MFRRFMIVCWVLFSMLVVTAAAGSGGFAYYASELEAIEALIAEHPSSAGNWSPEELADEMMSEKESNSLSDRIRRREALGELGRQQKRLSETMEILMFVALFAVGAAGVVLSWNVLCHTAHWVWQGRKVER